MAKSHYVGVRMTDAQLDTLKRVSEATSEPGSISAAVRLLVDLAFEELTQTERVEHFTITALDQAMKHSQIRHAKTNPAEAFAALREEFGQYFDEVEPET